MEVYAKCQEDIKANITRAKVNYKKSPKDRITQAYVETRLDTLEHSWTLFTETHRNILVEVDRADFESSAYYKNDVYGQTEELFVEYKSELKTVLSSFHVKVESATCSHTEPVVNVSKMGDPCCSVRLSDISIPKFSGKYEEWMSFRDLFVSLVHSNTRLDEVTKLRHLKAHLVGEAEQLLRHIPITNDNYEICWGMLERRYNNKKYLANCILKRLFNQKSVSVESSHAIKDLLDTTSECLSALYTLGINTSSWDVMIIFLISSKLDSESRKQWELKACEISDELPKFVQFQTFLENRFRALEFIEPKHIRNSQPSTTVKSLHLTTPSTCPCCNESHKISNCQKFVDYDVDTRRTFVQTSRLCYNCLCQNHSAFSCRQLSRCRVCKRKHHTLLHPENAIVSTDAQVKNHSVDKNVVAHASTSEAQDVTNFEVVGCLSNTSSQVLLATALVEAVSPTGNVVVLRCLLDQGSQTCLITESAVQLLGLTRRPNKSYISGLGGDGKAKLASQSLVSVVLHSLHDPEFKLEVRAHVLNKITTFLPEKKVLSQLWSEFANLELADPEFGTPNKIDMLLGADVYAQILCQGLIQGPPGSPIAQRTKLGWIISGRISTSEAPVIETCHNIVVSLHVTSGNENDLLKHFWEMESETSGINSSKHLTTEEQFCEDIFSQTTSRDDSRGYVVKLPFRDDDPERRCDKSSDIAQKRFLSLEKRLTSNPELKKPYTAVINEYLNLGHAEDVRYDQSQNEQRLCPPNHAVIIDERITTGVSVVFDSSCQGTNGAPVNNDMLIGPRLQLNLRHIIMCWRKYPISIVDIVKVYRHVKVADFQRLFWRDNPEDLLKHIRLLQVIFGTASALYLTVRKLQVAYNEGPDFPMASERVLKDFYADNLMTGCQSVPERIQMCCEIRELLNREDFELQKWSTSNDELLREISREDEIVVIDRGNGWMSSIIIVAVIFIQRNWVSGSEWDQEFPPDLLKDWLGFRNELCHVTLLVVLEWLICHPVLWKTFVADRVTEILTAVNRRQWSHESAKNNPADYASRGLKVGDCAEFKLWIESPIWLRLKVIKYSPQKIDETKLEEEPKLVCHVTTNLAEDGAISTRYSILRKLIRVLLLHNFTPWLSSSQPTGFAEIVGN